MFSLHFLSPLLTAMSPSDPDTTNDPPITPPSNKQSFHSSPTTQTLGTRDPEGTDHTRANYDMYLHNDLKNIKGEVAMEDFCTHLLHISTDAPSPSFTFDVENIESIGRALGEKYEWDFDTYAPRANVVRAQEIVNSPDFQRLNAEYKKAKPERARYKPFVKLVNHVLDKLRESQPAPGDLVFVRNDPQTLQGFQGEQRSSDVAGIRRKLMKFSKNGVETDRANDWDNKGPHMAPFHCRELLFFVEFERESNQTQGKDAVAATVSPAFLTFS